MGLAALQRGCPNVWRAAAIEADQVLYLKEAVPVGNAYIDQDVVSQLHIAATRMARGAIALDPASSTCWAALGMVAR